MLKQLQKGLISAALILVATGASYADDTAKAPEAKAPDAKPKRLAVGDPAPSIEAIGWIKGEPVKAFKEGEVYVIDCWATWCGPCVASIPHLNQLHNDFKDKKVNIIGLAVWPKKGMKPTKDFVEAKGDDMAYRIAEDTKEGTIAKTYLAAAGQNGIPCAFVIDQKGKVVWIGHPMDGLDDVVDEVSKGSFNAEAFNKAKADREAKAKDKEEAFQSAVESKDYEKGLVAADDLLKLDAKRYSGLKMFKYLALVNLGKKSEASTYGHALAKELTKQPNALNEFAWRIVDPEGDIKAEDRDADLAIEVATAACEGTKNKEPGTLDTLARAYFVKGDLAKAIEIQTKAVDLAKDDMKDQLQSALEEYKTAQSKKGG